MTALRRANVCRGTGAPRPAGPARTHSYRRRREVIPEPRARRRRSAAPQDGTFRTIVPNGELLKKSEKTFNSRGLPGLAKLAKYGKYVDLTYKRGGDIGRAPSKGTEPAAGE